MENASYRMYVWAVAVRSLTMSANASLRKSTEPHLRLSLKTFQQFLLPCPCGQRRVLLLTSEPALEAEVRDALRIRQQEREPGLFFELTYVDPALFVDFFGSLGFIGPRSDFLAVLDLLDHVRLVFRYGTCCSFSSYLVSVPPL